jgi:hypothetical protein
MTAVLWLLAVQGALGAFDTLYFHEWRAQLPARREMRSELVLHAARSAIYGIVFCTLPWAAWIGPAAVVLVGLLVIEAVITFADFVVEDRVRASLGGVYPGERVTHGLIAIVYGAFIAGLVPVLTAWIAGDGTAIGAGAPPLLLAGLTALGVGSSLSALRDALAAAGVAGSAWPWHQPNAMEPASEPTERARAARTPVLALGVLALLTIAIRRSRS